jgi:DNA-binding response OmpR family regulator
LYLGSDLDLLGAVRKVLAEPEYRLVACADRGLAILFLKSEIQYDALLIDFDWREEKGVELAGLARSLRHRKRMPIILVAAKLDDILKKAASEAGIEHCLMKTGDAKKLSELVIRVIG